MLRKPLRYGEWEITQEYSDIFVYVHDEFTGDTDDRAGSGSSIMDVIDEINEKEDEYNGNF